MKVIIIAAIARNGVIGRTSKACDGACDGRGTWCLPFECGPDRTCSRCNGTGRVPCNDIPWSYPEDMQHFRDVTTGHAVIMGRRTWEESLPEKHRPLKGRSNVVVTNKPTADIDTWAISLGDALRMTSGHSHAYIIGGAQLYAAALPLADELDLTLIDRDYEGDVKFPQGGAFYWAGLDPMFEGTELVDGSCWFECIERRKGEHPDLTFTRWVRR